ncbi:dynamin family protein [Calothrix brevissima NIES-22]|nr:dynamin family protein [Calothrix brevissima NIES-22]
MNTLLDNRQAIDLLSHLTGQKLGQKDLTPPVIFLASLVTVLVGVMFVDGKVTDLEKQRLLATLYRFSIPESDVRRLTHLLIKGVKENQLYTKADDLLILTAPLTESQRLLLIGFGYEMSAADGEIDSREKKYLEIVAKHLSINTQNLTILESAFTNQENIDLVALKEVRFLLDTARFHDLDTLFVKAARDMLATLPNLPETHVNQQRIAITYNELKKFQEHSQQLNNSCEQIFHIIQNCQQGGFLPESLLEEAKAVWEKNQSQRFRLAVVGEFSQGKSTLLNALLGETIQPAREIPCSGTVTVLKYGKQKRVVCLYKDGREEEIPFTEYQKKASISEEAAIDCLSDELAQSKLEELIFEHPDLELCSNGVEIVDSPGLNEHPERTAITKKLLANTDAVIFLTNASRPLTQGERDLLNYLKVNLNGGKQTEPANNLFVVCNFMDLIRTEKGKEQIKQRITKFVQGEHPIISGTNRIHFISAQATLDAIFNGHEDEYLKNFSTFKQSIEKFLTFESGLLKLERSIAEVENLIQKSIKWLKQAEDTLEGKIKLSEAEKQKILEQIGEASGRDVKIRLLANNLIEQVVEQANESWNSWIEKLEETLALKSLQWTSQHSGIWSRDKLAQDYAHQFNHNLSAELDMWINEQLKQSILKQPLEFLDETIQFELETINSEFQNFNYFSDNESNTWKFISAEQTDFISKTGFWGGFGAIGVGAALVPVIFMAGPILAIIAGMGAGLFGGGGIAIIEDSVREKVFQLGCEQFVNSLDSIFENLDNMIISVFNERIEIAAKKIEQAISFYENLLEQQEKFHQQTVEDHHADKVIIDQKYQEFEQINHKIKSIINV